MLLYKKIVAHDFQYDPRIYIASVLMLKLINFVIFVVVESPFICSLYQYIKQMLYSHAQSHVEECSLVHFCT
jgi:hypothetical protein